MKRITSREFNQDVSRAKQGADHGPVVITDRGKPAYVLLRYEEWQRIAGGGRNLADLLAMPESNEIEIGFEPVRIALGAADLP